jgi:hypothetical protein
MAGEKWEAVRRWATIAGVLVMVPVVYVLSIGPVACWCRMREDAGNLSDERIESLESFYSPLLLVLDHNGPIGNTLNWYIDLWL